MVSDRQRDLGRFLRQLGPSLIPIGMGIFGLIWFQMQADTLLSGSPPQFKVIAGIMLLMFVLQLVRAIRNAVAVVRDERRSKSSVASTTQFEWDDNTNSFD